MSDSDFKYLVICVRDEFMRNTYQSGEPEEMHTYKPKSYTGGFGYDIAKAILYPDRQAARKACNKMRKCYPDFKMRVIKKSGKDIFTTILEGRK